MTCAQHGSSAPATTAPITSASSASSRSAGSVFRFLRADGRELEQHIDPRRLTGTDDPIEDEHDDIHNDAATPRWTGERMDRDWAISVLALRRSRAAGRRAA